MGTVYRAHEDHLDRDVAVKVLTVNALKDKAARKRSRKEALALSMLSAASSLSRSQSKRTGEIQIGKSNSEYGIVSPPYFVILRTLVQAAGCTLLTNGLV
jgi:serine/threonine protein kinase